MILIYYTFQTDVTKTFSVELYQILTIYLLFKKFSQLISFENISN